MQEDIFRELNLQGREDAVRFLKDLWCETPGPCPLCGGKLDHFHRKAKKSNCDWICTVCRKRFDTIRILDQLNEG